MASGAARESREELPRHSVHDRLLAETMMMGATDEELIGKRRTRQILKNLISSKAGTIPHHKIGILRVRVIGSPFDAADDAVRGPSWNCTVRERNIPEPNYGWFTKFL